MRIRTGNDFACTPAQAYAMLTDPAFWRAVADASHPLSYDVSVDGRRVRTRRVLPSDPSVAKITGPTITIVDEIFWDDSGGDERYGLASVEVEGLPASIGAAMGGTVWLHAGGRGALLDYEGDLDVAVPLIGPLLERRAAAVLTEAIGLQQQVADAWVAPSDPDVSAYGQ